MAKSSKPPIITELSRDLGLNSALAIGVGTMIAAGIFTLSGLAIRNVGSAAIASFLLAAFVALLTALTYCEFAALYPRSGEGYYYARKSYPLPLAFVVGWTLFLGYSASCAFYIASFSSYFHEFIWHMSFPALSGVVMLIILTLLNIKGTKESGSFQIVVTLGKVLLLVWFIIGGLKYVNYRDLSEGFSTDLYAIGSTATLVFITFFGFSAIAASAGEVKNPVKNIPKAIFISMGVVTVLYILVVIVVQSANLSEYNESAMGSAARNFLGPVGGMVIVAGALFSMISASNASIMAGSRVTMSMAQLGHFPRGFGWISQRTKTPIVSLALVGGTIILFSVSLALEDLAHFADTVLLIALILVNSALIIHRRKYPDVDRPFKVPLVPLLPALGILANIYLLTQIIHHQFPVLIAIISLGVGFLGFIAWKGILAKEPELEGVPSKVALERSVGEEEVKYRILVPLANPSNVPQLIKLAAAIAADRKGEIVALRVALIPEQLPPSRATLHAEREHKILENAISEAQKYDVPLTALIRVGHNVERAIIETAEERNCDLILMGWKGYTSSARKVLSESIDVVVNHVRTDVMLVKLTPDADFSNILLPTAGGEHARFAEGLAASIARNLKSKLTVSTVVRPSASEEQRQEAHQKLTDAEKRILETRPETNVAQKLIEHQSIQVGIIKESANYNTVMIGAAGKSFSPKFLFGTIPDLVAKHTKGPIILVKHYNPVKAIIKRVVKP